MKTSPVPVAHIENRIVVIREQKVIIDADLAALYGVETRRLNEQVHRNRERFPADFIFELTTAEFANLKSQFATSSWGGRRKLALAFTEHSAIMAATARATTGHQKNRGLSPVVPVIALLKRSNCGQR